MGRLTRILALVLGLLFATGIIGILYVRHYVHSPLPLAQSEIFSISPGQGTSSVAGQLERDGLLKHSRLFSLYARYLGVASNIKAGEYLIDAGQTPAGLLSQFVEGRVVLHSLTLVEGWTFRQALDAIRSHPAVDAVLNIDDGSTIVRLAKLPTDSPEGWLLPETYHFPRGTTDIELLSLAANAMRDSLADAWDARDEGLPLKNSYEALILASIVEKETGIESERSRIAGVFVRRLKKGMRLQTDPTVIYGLGASYTGNLRRSDLERDTPFNTYTRHGLPPTPIALPGMGALLAVAHPADEDALYFVATGKGDGTHYFSKTLEEHNQAVARYLARLRESRGKAK
ncbi:MAG: endolytic transglycosylase MltG [Gammaproteobacteria bacterium]|nr:MAG: endolytic transglycosylase MltG [Gammaproteobacteria bacterium]